MRPENITLDGSSAAGKNHFKGKISFAAYLGNTLRYDVDLGAHHLQGRRRRTRGTTSSLRWARR